MESCSIGQSCSGGPVLTGRITRAALDAIPGWGAPGAEGYTPDLAAIATIRRHAATLEVLAFVGTWCPDCHRDTPRLLKIADEAGLPSSRITIYGLDRSKTDSEGLVEQWNIVRLPTFILIRDGRELGRVIERPKSTLEQDIAQILTSQSD